MKGEGDGWTKWGGGGVIEGSVFPVKDVCFVSMRRVWNGFDGARGLSAKSMRSKVERRMRKESGKTLREIRRAKKLRKKLMTDEERLIYNLRRVRCSSLFFFNSNYLFFTSILFKASSFVLSLQLVELYPLVTKCRMNFLRSERNY